MTENLLKQLSEQIKTLESALEKQEKISAALLTRVKNNLKYQVNINEVFEHNTYLMNEIKETKRQLYTQAETSQKFSYLAKHDSLTGLINRGEFESRLKQAVQSAQHYSQNHALFFMDLDQFKVVNDTSGHIAGDEMLKQIAGLLSKCFRETDVLARLGGDEFSILMENSSSEQALDKANNILKAIDRYRFPWEKNIFTVSASIGLVFINEKTASHIDALKHADIACYAAKNSGRNRIHVYEHNNLDLLQQNDKMHWVPKIVSALENNSFRLYTQIIQPTDKNRNFVNYEVLVRMLDDNGELIPPGAFLPTAERYNLIIKIDLWVLKTVFDWLQTNAHHFHVRTHFSINLSGQSLCDEHILDYIVDWLDANSSLATKVQFEVTETMAISNLKTANYFIKTIKKYGCGFSLDDFGSGLSSFAYLKNLDVDTLKIDGIFVRDILEDETDSAMVSSINTIGHVMKMETIAEYVENDAVANKLTEIGVDYLQGYGIGVPVPIDEILPE